MVTDRRKDRVKGRRSRENFGRAIGDFAWRHAGAISGRPDCRRCRVVLFGPYRGRRCQEEQSDNDATFPRRPAPDPGVRPMARAGDARRAFDPGPDVRLAAEPGRAERAFFRRPDVPALHRLDAGRQQGRADRQHLRRPVRPPSPVAVPVRPQGDDGVSVTRPTRRAAPCCSRSRHERFAPATSNERRVRLPSAAGLTRPAVRAGRLVPDRHRWHHTKYNAGRSLDPFLRPALPPSC